MSGPASIAVSAPLTLGVEEEFHVVDPVTRRLVARAPDVLAALPSGYPRAQPELQASVVEGNSGVCTEIDALREDLVGLRADLVGAADSVGLALIAAGTVPLADPAEITVTPDARYRRMRDDYAQLVREQLICGVQTHVGLAEPGLALAVAGRLARWQPVLLAISASSPFWLGTDTGYASWRSQVWRRWPTTGPLPPISSLDGLDELSAALVATGVVSDTGMLYWDLRLNRTTGTLEFRLGDACPTLEVTLALAALARGLVAAARDDLLAGRAERAVPVPVVEAARWRASRSGLTGELVDPVSGRPLPAGDVLDRLIDHTGPALRAVGDLDIVTATLTGVLRGGGSAGRQRALAEQDLEPVVDALVAETAGRTSWGC